MFSDIVSSELRSLRSYAQLLLGTPDEGDQAVCDVLQGLIETATSADMGGMDRTSLFQQLDEALYPLAQERMENECTHPILHELTLIERRVLLLCIVGGFNIPELSRITGLHEPEIRQVLAHVQTVVHAATRTGVLIIEDDPHMAELLSVLVEQTGHWVAGVAHTRDEAVKLAGEQSFGLILSDIELGEEVCGKMAVTTIRETLGYDVPTIYITAHPERLEDADSAGQDGLVPKPFDIWRVREAVNRAINVHMSIFA